MGPGLKRVLIANRGEIAVRIARACRELGIGSVAAYERADRRSLHTEVADEAVEVASYLDADALVDAAPRAAPTPSTPATAFSPRARSSPRPSPPRSSSSSGRRRALCAPPATRSRPAGWPRPSASR
jgi:hypothetical protein